jgi:N-methylhydantoinase A
MADAGRGFRFRVSIEHRAHWAPGRAILAATPPEMMPRRSRAAIPRAHGVVRAGMREEGIEDECVELTRELGMRYVGQSWELVVAIDREVESMQRLESVFRAAHEMRYGHSVDEPMEIVTVRVVTLGRMAKPRLSASVVEREVVEVDSKCRDVFFDGSFRRTEVHVREALVPGVSLPGPLLVEEMGAMTVVPPAWTLSVGELGEFHLNRN